MLLRNHIISRPMCRSRLFHIVGWSRVINNVGNTLHLYQDLFNKDASYVNGAAVVTSQAVTNGWTYGISDLLLPEISMLYFDDMRPLSGGIQKVCRMTGGKQHKSVNKNLMTARLKTLSSLE